MFRPRLASFRHLLLTAFVLIAALLGSVAINAVLTLDRLMAQHAEGAARALKLIATTQTLAGHTTAMERAARQSLILNDAPLARRARDEAQAASVALAQLAAEGLPETSTQRWRAQLDAITRLLPGQPTRGQVALQGALERERRVAREFRELDLQTDQLAQQVQQLIGEQNAALRERLAQSQTRLTRLVAAAVAFTLALAVGLGLWLARPFRQIARAITGLGENQLAQAIAIGGPSDVRAVGQQLDWLRLRLSELDADKARFLRHVSHELKTPLAALREGSALLEDGVTGTLNARQREVARILRQNVQTLQEQIEALLRFNAAAFEARQLRRSPTDLLTLTRAQVHAQQLQWQARGLTVRVRGEPLTLPLDAEKMGMAIANLLSNAIRHSPPGDIIEFTLGAEPGLARLDIRDQGAGVAVADRARIFEPFYRGQRQPPDGARGSGVGLSIVQEYIAAHGGRIELLPDETASAPDPTSDAFAPGAHFRIELPHADL